MALVVFIDDVVPIQHGPGLVAGYFHAIMLIVSGPTQVPNATSAHVMRNNALDADLLARGLKRLRERLYRFALAVKDEWTIGPVLS